MTKRRYLRHMWSHRHPLHRAGVRMANRVLRRIPFGLKYDLGLRFSKNDLPYRLLDEGDVAVQVGAPRDTLHSGRSRAIYLALCVGRRGKVVVVEPDPENARALREVATERDLPQLHVVQSGAWSCKKQLVLYVDPEHPATNFTEDTTDYDEERLASFEKVTVDVDSLDRILDAAGVDRVKLVSITTNGAERMILEGLSRTLTKGVPHLSLAETDADLHTAVIDLGYEQVGFDDRGYTFVRKATPEARERTRVA